jgi:hypothetical protein
MYVTSGEAFGCGSGEVNCSFTPRLSEWYAVCTLFASLFAPEDL